MYYTYIIKSQKNNSYYIGSCKNLQDRITKHNKGLVKSTKRYLPWKLIYYEFFHTLKEARKREKQIKSWKKRAAIEKLIKNSKFK
ncbi:GIY-YIG nuclease family protein [Patescibacteria group bacterium]|nr:GIY-YIG nuclease family protein [Patescibacteria group bacterium]